ncbi:MAG: hypothetical protein ACTSUP_08125 [Candidatus Heimdallarchaeaceae archaeon]
MSYILAAIRMISLVLSIWKEKDEKLKIEKKQALRDIKKGFTSKNKDSIHRTIDRIKRRF